MTIQRITPEELWSRQQISSLDTDYKLWDKKRTSIQAFSQISPSCIFTVERQGLLSKEIAYKLHLSIYTVNNHRKHILSKLQAGNAIEAINRAEDYGLLY